MYEWLFEWDPEKDMKNRRIHGISFEVATAVFDDPMIYEFYDKNHSGLNKYGEWEDRFIAIGKVGMVLFVVYTIRKKKKTEICRMISARKAKKPEIREYEKWCRSIGGDPV